MRPFADPNNSYSYEDWMNDMATREPRNNRGWHARWQTRCDCCGRFVLAGQPGSSWVMVPHSDVSFGDERERCAACTKKHGPACAAPGYVTHLVEGVVAESAPPAQTAPGGPAEALGPDEQNQGGAQGKGET